MIKPGDIIHGDGLKKLIDKLHEQKRVLSSRIGNNRFAQDHYRGMIRAYSLIIEQIEKHHEEEIKNMIVDGRGKYRTLICILCNGSGRLPGGVLWMNCPGCKGWGKVEPKEPKSSAEDVVSEILKEIE